MNRRQFIHTMGALGLGSMAILSIPGCGPSGPTAKTTEKSLNILWGSHMEFIDVWAPVYKERYGIEPSIELITTQDLRNKLSSTFVARTSPWDAIFIIPDVIAPSASHGWLTDLTDRFMNSNVLSRSYSLSEVAAKSGYFNGQVVAVPIHIGCPVMMWNKKLMEDCDLDPDAPNSWHNTKNSYDEFLKYAKKMSFQKNGTQNYGYIDNWAGENVLWTYTALVQMHGGDLVTPDEKPVMNSDACVEALEKMVDMLHTHQCIDPASMTYAWVFDCAPSFMNGTRGVFITWPFMATLANTAEDAAIKGYVGCAPNFSVDTSASVDGSEFLSIPIFSNNPDEGWRFIELMTSYEVQKSIGTTTGWFPIYEELLMDAEVIANNPVAPVVKQAYQYPAKNYRTANFARWSNILSTSIHDALARRNKPKDVLNEAVRRISEAL